jgi:hypothetical protein
MIYLAYVFFSCVLFIFLRNTVFSKDYTPEFPSFVVTVVLSGGLSFITMVVQNVNEREQLELRIKGPCHNQIVCESVPNRTWIESESGQIMQDVRLCHCKN